MTKTNKINRNVVSIKKFARVGPYIYLSPGKILQFLQSCVQRDVFLRENVSIRIFKSRRDRLKNSVKKKERRIYANLHILR